ncbi:putative magnesium transporter NIPA6, partial [Mucuna pruriens]
YLNKVDNITLLVEGATSKDGVLGFVSCIVGSVNLDSVQEVWDLATQPVSIVLALILHIEPRYGQTNIWLTYGNFLYVVNFHIDVATLELTVVSIKAIGIAIELTLDGISQIAYPHTWFFLTMATMYH